jgi:hypothetical protein
VQLARDDLRVYIGSLAVTGKPLFANRNLSIRLLSYELSVSFGVLTPHLLWLYLELLLKCLMK